MPMTIYPPPPVEVLPFSLIKSIQRGVSLVPDDLAYHGFTINSVDVTKTMVNLIGANYPGAGDIYQISAGLSTPTHLVLACRREFEGGFTDVSWEVIEYI